MVVRVVPTVASHLVGGELSYQYLGVSPTNSALHQYRITALIYNNSECTPGTNVSNYPDGRSNVFVSIYNKATGNLIDSRQGTQTFISLQISCGPVVTLNEPQPNGTFRLPRVANPIITPTQLSACTAPGGTPPRVRLCRYEAVVDLPESALGYYAVYSDGTRSMDVTNLRNPTQQNQTLYVEITPPRLFNSSPSFSDTAVVVICQGDTSLVLNNAVDPDGDRLVYAFSTPYNGPMNAPATFTPPPAAVTYADGYSAAAPFGTGAGNYIELNARTGLSRYSAAQSGRYVVAVEVQEYRSINGAEVLLGSTRREVQLVVQRCPTNQKPQFTAATLNTRSFTVEEGQSLSFNVAASDADGDPLTMRATSVLLDGFDGHNAEFAGLPGLLPPTSIAGSVTIRGTGGNVGGEFVFNTRCGDARPTPYDVVVTTTDAACGAKSVAEVFQITVIKATPPINITGSAVVCDLGSTYAYTAGGTAASAYQWKVYGGAIQGATTGATVQVRWNTVGTGRLTVQKIVEPACLSDSASRMVEIRPPVLVDAGPDATVCPTAQVRLGTPAQPGLSYQWSPATNLSSATSAQPIFTAVNTTASPITLTYTLTATTAEGCAATSTVQVRVNSAPTASITGPRSVCPEQLTGIRYSATGLAGSTFQWAIIGGTLVSGQGTSSIVVDFAADAEARSVSVIETSTTNCSGAPNTLAVSLDDGRVSLRLASVDAQSDARISLTLNTVGTPPPGSRITVLRREAGSMGAYTTVGNVANNAATFTDASLDTDARAYQYQLQLTNACGTVLSSTEHTTVRLEAVATQSQGGRDEGRVTLRWNRYLGLNIAQYAIFRRVDGGPEELVQIVPTTGAAQYTVELTTGSLGFNQCFRVRAQALPSDLESFSNEVCVNFANPLAFYNIITPNGDGRNDVVYIDNVQLYPGHTFSIFNRWGKEIYTTANYRNTWGGEGATAGVYYYVFKLADGTKKKGWFEIVK
ncbi:hypothetical protein GCM10011383_38860 [Hymenobacter cavernae]|uniref:PKD-like domain-containing protein n=1 Tax=Hymenobacter cavernae TaxID=2044852 RepID=A0ABQ1URP3_9BACT|nr:hypothetical protein GCM10011383_38860 [Hymenobacter cavernae]